MNHPSCTALPADVVAKPHEFRVLTGERPTGPLHIGHYFGSLQNRVRLQNHGVDLIMVIADYQVLTDRDIHGDLSNVVHGLVLDYLAVGLDPDNTTIFVHSAIASLNQLLLPFLSLVSNAELQRNPTVKEEIAASRRDAVSGLMYTYPAHQAADILSCGANLVPVGDDQLPHLELTRTIARRFNQRYARLFPPIEALLSSTPRLIGLDGRDKMSKSRGNTIDIRDSADDTARRIKAAVTDSQRHITFDPQNRPHVANLLRLAALCRNEDPHAVAVQVGNGGAAGLKKLTIEAVNEHFAPIRARRRAFAQDPALVKRILKDGSLRANSLADATLAQVKEAMGMRY